jgi:hypothetical protein
MNNKERKCSTKENNVERRSKGKTCNTEEGWDRRCIYLNVNQEGNYKFFQQKLFYRFRDGKRLLVSKNLVEALRGNNS